MSNKESWKCNKCASSKKSRYKNVCERCYHQSEKYLGWKKEWSKEYYKKNKEKLNKNYKKWLSKPENLEKHRAYMRKSYHKRKSKEALKNG